MQLEPVLKFPVIFLLAFGVTFLLTPVIRSMAIRFGVVDQPGGRRIHERVIPRAGGIAVFLGFQVGAFAVFYFPWLPFSGQLQQGWWCSFLLPSSLILLLGLWDDTKSISPILKLGGQVLVAAIAVALDMRMGNVLGKAPPLWLDIILSIAWYLILMNAFNLIDGMDGLATGLAFVAACGLALSLLLRRAPGDVMLLLALAGACLAFLRYNFHPASIFLGDSGSMFLGFTLGALALSTQSKGPALAVIGFPLVAMGIPLIDTLLAIWRRSARIHGVEGVRPVHSLSSLATADGDHLHHRFIQRGWSQRKVALSLYGLAAGSTVLGLLMLAYRSRAQGILLIAFVGVAYVIFRHLAQVELWESGAAVLRGLSKPSHRNISIVAYPILDLVALTCSLGLTFVLISFGPLDPPPFRLTFLKLFPLFVGLPMLGMAVVKAYSRVWSMARISELMELGFACVAGILIGLGIFIVGEDKFTFAVTVMGLVHAGVSLAMILGIRTFVRVVQDVMASRSHAQETPTLLVGPSSQGSVFLRAMSLHPLPEYHQMHIVGVIDDDLNLQGRVVHGRTVLGGVPKLTRLIKDRGVQQLVLLTGLLDEELEVIRGVAGETGVKLVRWTNAIETHVDLKSDSEQASNSVE